MWAAHGALTATVSIAWFLGLSKDTGLDAHLSIITVWIGCSIGSTAIVEFLLRAPFVRRFIFSSIVSGLSRFVN